ncbi:MAG: hypothetical protein Q4B42_00890, partial [Oscillospiraceae bacterium]|nr:hypothetical protein [Oscillospiraceae bacterium]
EAGLKELFGGDSAVRLNPSESGEISGRLRLGATLFTLRMRPYDALISAEGCRAALRLNERDGETAAVVAAACEKGCGFSPTESELEGFLLRLAEAAAAHGGREHKSAPKGAKRVYKSAKTSEDGASKEKAAHGSHESTQAKPKKHRPLFIAAAALILAAAALWLFWPFGASVDTAEPDDADLSELLTAENAASVNCGMGRSEIEALFGTSGLKLSSGVYLYRSSELNGRSQPVRQLKAEYAGDLLESYTYLDLSIAEQTGTVASPPLDIGTYPVSMIRGYTKNGELYKELHIGYVDPFANFSPSWRGEAVLISNESAGTSQTLYLKGYDGADPLMQGELEGTALESQYEDYDEFLSDKLAYDTALLLVNGYSRGDAESVFGALEQYDAGSGSMLWRTRAGEADEGGEQPYTYSFRFDASGGFELGVFSNTRLYERAGTLAQCKPQAVAAGQSYGEVRTLMPIVPTALYVNDNFYTVCYGRYTGGTDIKYQFELVVSFDKTTNIADSVYDNTISSAA